MQEYGEKALLIVLLAAAALSLGLAGLGHNWRWLLTAALAMEIAGVLQLKISGLFSSSPSTMAAGTAGPAQLGDILFNCKHTGFYLLAVGLVAQLVSVWVW